MFRMLPVYLQEAVEISLVTRRVVCHPLQVVELSKKSPAKDSVSHSDILS